MAAFSSHRYLFGFLFLVLNLWLKTMNAEGKLSFSFKNFRDSSQFESLIALLGNAKVVHKNSSVEISGSVSSSSSAGRMICKHPFSLSTGNSTNQFAFSSSIVFSVSSGNGNGFAFVMLPFSFPLNLTADRQVKSFAVEFNAFKDENSDDKNIGLAVESNVSNVKLKFSSREKMQAWINYEASGKRLEISLSKFGRTNHQNIPLLSCPIDLSLLWKHQQILIGLRSFSGNSSHKTNIYSWSFESRNLANPLLHSVPMNIENFVGMTKELGENKKSDDRILAALIFGIACGGMGMMFVVFVWALVGGRRLVFPEGDGWRNVEWKKVDVYGVEGIEDGKK